MKFLKNLKKDDMLKLMAIIAMTDGTIAKEKKYLKSLQLRTAAYNECQHEMFKELCQRVFKKDPKVRVYRQKETEMLSSSLFGKDFILELFKLSPSYKTTKANGETEGRFLSSIQPSLKFILKSKDKELQKLALRMWLDFDGCIMPSFKIKHKIEKRNNRLYEYYQVQFECSIDLSETNPNLVKELGTLCKKLKIDAALKKDKRKWSGIDGIRITKLESIKRFIEFGGPITEVKISAKSKRFFGKTKRAVCEATLNLLNKKEIRSNHFRTNREALIKQSELNSLLVKEIDKVSN